MVLCLSPDGICYMSHVTSFELRVLTKRLQPRLRCPFRPSSLVSHLSSFVLRHTLYALRCFLSSVFCCLLSGISSILHLTSYIFHPNILSVSAFYFLFTALFVILVSDFVIPILIFYPFYFILLRFALRSSPYALCCLLPTPYSLLLTIFHIRTFSIATHLFSDHLFHSLLISSIFFLYILLSSESISIAKIAAFFAPLLPIPILATGTPEGI